MRSNRGEVTGIDPAKMAKLVTESRAEGTLSSYGASLRRVWQFGLQIDYIDVDSVPIIGA